jgi:hypothetical protein
MGFRGKKVDPTRHNNGTPVASGNPSRSNAVSLAPPPLTEGKGRCPACRNAVTVLRTGTLRRHSDLFGNPCWNQHLTETPVRIGELPPVVIATDAKKGECRQCGKWLPGERSLCGRCSVLRDAS